MRELIDALDAWAAAGRRGALCTVVAVHGRAPLPVGACMAVAEDGAVIGALSGGCVEQEAGAVAQGVLRGARAQRLRFAPGGDPLTGAGLPCGGGIDVWVQPWGAGELAGAQEAFAAAVRAGEAADWTFPVGPVAGGSEPTIGVASAGGPFTLRATAAQRLVLVGAGPVAGALCDLAPMLGMQTLVVDPRENVAAHAPIERAGELLLCWPQDAFARLAPLSERDVVLALSHQPSIDDAALGAALQSGAGFIGALGSRAAHADRLARLRGAGHGEAALARIVGPVGLDLGGWSASEVALSITAELVAARHGRQGGRLAEADGSIHDALEMVDAQGVADGVGARAGEAEAAIDHGTAAPLSALVLAAGAGRRFGGAKQVAQWEGEALVARAVRAAATGLPPGSEIIVVLGAHAATVEAALPGQVPHRVVIAPDWAEGLGASVRAGIRAASHDRVLVLLADQPLVDGHVVAEVVRHGMPALEDGAAAARPVVDGTPGHPVLLGPIALTRVADLSGDRGLAPLISGLYVHAVPVSGPAPFVDVDEPADLLRAPRPGVGGPRRRPGPSRSGPSQGTVGRPVSPRSTAQERAERWT